MITIKNNSSSTFVLDPVNITHTIVDTVKVGYIKYDINYSDIKLASYGNPPYWGEIQLLKMDGSKTLSFDQDQYIDINFTGLDVKRLRDYFKNGIYLLYLSINGVNDSNVIITVNLFDHLSYNSEEVYIHVGME